MGPRHLTYDDGRFDRGAAAQGAVHRPADKGALVQARPPLLTTVPADASLDTATFVEQVMFTLVRHCGAQGGGIWVDDATLGNADGLHVFAYQLYILGGANLIQRSVLRVQDRKVLTLTSDDLRHLQGGGILRHQTQGSEGHVAHEHYRKLLHRAGTRHIAYLPLGSGPDYLGFITARFGGDDGLLPEDEMVALMLADQIASALRMSPVVAEARKADAGAQTGQLTQMRIANIERVNAVLSEALSGLQDFKNLESFSLKILTAAESLAGATSCTFMLADEARQRLTPVAGVRQGQAVDVAVHPDLAPWRDADAPTTQDDLDFWDETFKTPRYSWMSVNDPVIPRLAQCLARSRGQVSVARIPLWDGDRLLGVLDFGFARADQPTQGEGEVLRLVAQQITLAYRFTRLGAKSREAAVSHERKQLTGLHLVQLQAMNAAQVRSITELSIQNDMRAFLHSLLDTVLLQMGAGSGAVWLAGPGGAQQMPVYRAGNAVPVEVETAAPVIDRLLEVIGHQRPRGPWMSGCIATSPLLDALEPVRRALVTAGIAALLAVPVIAGEQVFGTMAVWLRTPCPWSPEQVELAQAQANQAALALEMRRLGDIARQNAIVEERNRFARDIHDTLAQDFIAIATHLRAAQRKLAATSIADGKGVPIVAALDMALEMAQEGLLEARRSVWGLVPRAVEQGGGLAVALSAMVARIAPGRVVISAAGQPRTLAVDVEGELLAIVREAVHNAVCHAGTSATVGIRVTYNDHALQVRIDDDGRGYDTGAHGDRAPGHFGLWAMRERAARIGGHLDLVSHIGAGTHVFVSVPWAT